MQEQFGIEAEAGRERDLPRVFSAYLGKSPPAIVAEGDDDEVRANPERFELQVMAYTMITSRALPEDGEEIGRCVAVRQSELAAMRGVRRETVTRTISRYAPLVECLYRKHPAEPVEFLERERQFALPNVYSWHDQPARITEWCAVLEHANDEGDIVHTEVVKRGFLTEENCRKYCEVHSANAKPQTTLIACEMELPNEERWHAATLEQLCADPLTGHLWDKTLLEKPRNPRERRQKVNGFKPVPTFIWDGRICVQDWIVVDDLGKVHGRWPLRRTAQAYVDELKKDQADEKKKDWARTQCSLDAGLADRLTVREAPEDWVVEERGSKGVELGRWKTELEARAFVARAIERGDPRVDKMTVCRRARRLSDTARLVMTYYFMCGLLDTDKKTGAPRGEIHPYASTVAMACGLCTKAVYDANCELESIGLIRVAHSKPKIVLENGKQIYRRGPCIIIYLPIRQLTHEEAAAERERIQAELKCCSADVAAKIAPIHEDLLQAWEGHEHRLSAFWNEFVRRMLAAGVIGAVARTMIPQPAAPQ